MTLTRTAKQPLKQTDITNLSPNEVTAWLHLANGLTIKQAGEQMGVTYTDITRYRRRLFFIMECKNLADLTRSAIKNNIITA
jgi:DNA-binding CsgD family transcriptional regulator